MYKIPEVQYNFGYKGQILIHSIIIFLLIIIIIISTSNNCILINTTQTKYEWTISNIICKCHSSHIVAISFCSWWL